LLPVVSGCCLQEAEWVENICTSLCILTIIMSIIVGKHLCCRTAALHPPQPPKHFATAINISSLHTCSARQLGVLQLEVTLYAASSSGSDPHRKQASYNIFNNSRPCAENMCGDASLCVCLIPVPGAVLTKTSNFTPFAPNGFNGIFKGASMVFFAYLVSHQDGIRIS
jgi:hypothetical protein